MPAFYERLRNSLTYPLAWGNSSVTDYGEWRKEARRVLLDCMQPAPPAATAYDMEVLAVEQREGYEARKILFNVSDYSRVPA